MGMPPESAEEGTIVVGCPAAGEAGLLWVVCCEIADGPGWGGIGGKGFRDGAGVDGGGKSDFPAAFDGGGLTGRERDAAGAANVEVVENTAAGTVGVAEKRCMVLSTYRFSFIFNA